MAKKSSCDGSWVKLIYLGAEKQIASLAWRWRPSWPRVLSSQLFVPVFCAISLVVMKAKIEHVHRHNRGHMSQDLPLWGWCGWKMLNINCGQSPGSPWSVQETAVLASSLHTWMPCGSQSAVLNYLSNLPKAVSMQGTVSPVLGTQDFYPSFMKSYI